MISRQFMVDLLPGCDESVDPFIKPLNEVIKSHGLDRPVRAAAFIAQVSHESVRFTMLAQIVNYSARGLVRVFPQFFTPEQAIEYSHNPYRIASRIYAGKFGNGDEQSGDGWKYRSRGLIHRVSGRSWYSRSSQDLTKDENTFLNNPKMLTDPYWAVQVAAWFWTTNGCVALSDACSSISFRQITKRVNGNLHGLSDRMSIYNRALRAWGIKPYLAEDLGTATADGEGRRSG